MFAGLGLDIAVAFAKRYWKPLLFGAIGLGIATTIAVQHWRINNLTAARVLDKQAIAAAVSANVANTKAILDLQQAAAFDRHVTADAVRQAKVLAEATETAVQEIQNAPGATNLSGPMFDDLGDRLRALDKDRHSDKGGVP